MHFRKFGKLDWEVSSLGFGCMRLPTLDGKPMSAAIDESQAIRMIRSAVDGGVNYFDSAYVYHGGRSEEVLGKALQNGYRNRVKIATKSPLWIVESGADFDRLLEEQLRRLDTEHIDFYLFHGLNQKVWRGKVLRLGLLERAEQAIRSGRIGHLGFSFHDTFDVFTEILDGYPGWEFCQIQYNFMDTENQAGAAGLKLAAGRGLAVVVMSPLLGGRLANPPAAIGELFMRRDSGRPPAYWALKWIWNQPEVTTVLSGMSSQAQVDANLSFAEDSAPGSLSASDQDFISVIKAKYRERTAVNCTQCNYCMPCPSGVNIPGNFGIYNDAFMHDDPEVARFLYKIFISPPEQASACTACRECEQKCPQQIPISEWMPKIHAFLSAG